MKRTMIAVLLVMCMVFWGGQAKALVWLADPAASIGSGVWTDGPVGLDGTGTLWDGTSATLNPLEQMQGLLGDINAGDILTFEWSITTPVEVGGMDIDYGFFMSDLVTGTFFNTGSTFADDWGGGSNLTGNYSYTFSAADAALIGGLGGFVGTSWDLFISGQPADTTGFSASFTFSAVPEPTTMLLLGTGLLGLAGARRRFKK